MGRTLQTRSLLRGFQCLQHGELWPRVSERNGRAGFRQADQLLRRDRIFRATRDSVPGTAWRTLQLLAEKLELLDMGCSLFECPIIFLVRALSSLTVSCNKVCTNGGE